MSDPTGKDCIRWALDGNVSVNLRREGRVTVRLIRAINTMFPPSPSAGWGPARASHRFMLQKLLNDPRLHWMNEHERALLQEMLAELSL